MRDIADGLAAWQLEGRRAAIATVVQTWNSAPRQPGAAMAVADDGTVIGSVSGGCVEGAVYDVAEQVLATGQAQLHTYGVTDGDALAVGLTCGGIVEIFVAPADPEHFPELPDVLDTIAVGQPVAVAWTIVAEDGIGRHVVVTPDGVTGSLGNPGLDVGAIEQTQGMLEHGSTGVIRLGRHGEQRMDEVAIFVQAFAPPPRMLIFGAIDLADAVARMGKFLGYHVTICDARPAFATRLRFPEVDELVVTWPHRYLDEIVIDERTVICVLAHDSKFETPLLERAVRSPARYIGVMGGRRAHAERLDRLREVGVTEEELARLRAPIGLDLGAETPHETAVAIAAEITAVTWGGSGERLSSMGDLAIHR